MATHILGGLTGNALVGAALGRFFQFVGGDHAPVGFDAAGLNNRHLNAEVGGLHAQRIAEGFKGVLGGVVPGTHEGGEAPAH